ncbi:coumaroyl-CoA:anthocyanidin 3-O-glucoside-6''-O-coumaroyltransferase 1-like [Pyrus ussuriensis x Pyrus communis]|uniref:Coumaroyl-CoA:anthocyanidin 3-O-glucoside-6''-O-coumaroyltransferase 1-like n=1 Tax=Pyrus ussuriensis x Pyrus communis TaxID=2448454 RepID=A0A5N5GIH3_9ROSA|nr:coumaroyl-CoA:anthocyanidin 3-O-glucoside-6''-O-coumaroyltransferase 1-like [Pyrus ussuriensis x Pyrus communis]
MKALDGRETAMTSMKGDDLLRIRFAADIRGLFQSPVPITYFGNCLSACYVAEKKREIVAEYGIVKAVKALEGAMKNGHLEGLKRMVPSQGKLVVAESGVAIARSPTLGVYGLILDGEE